VARLYDGLICLLPFEPPYFTAEGLYAVFAGHPAVENVKTLPDGQAFRAAQGIAPDACVLGVFFGSRASEVTRMGPVIRDALIDMSKRGILPLSMTIMAPTLPHLQDRVARLLKDCPFPAHIVTDGANKWSCMAAMDSAIAVSGTIGLELAISRVPHVILYKMNGWTWRIVKKRVKVRYAHLANILMDDEVVPEFIQNRCQSALIADAAMNILNVHGYAATAQRTAFTGLSQKLAGSKNNAPPSEQAARYILDLFSKKRG
jgi:lipid-A-disaccharide synthase